MLLHMPRTTLVIEEQLLREIKKKSVEEGRTLQAVTNDLLRCGLSAASHRKYRLHLRGWKAKQLPGVDLFDRDSLFDLMNGR
jgi:hypothetical protein